MTGPALIAAGVLLILYAYAGYTALMLLWARVAPRPTQPDPTWEPTVSVCLACRNEGERLSRKLEGLLALDYPADKLEILVLDDGSDDDTAARGEAFSARGVCVLRAERPAGKAAALNRLAAEATGAVLLLVDTRQRVDPGALRALVAELADPTVGAVSGELVFEEQPAGEARPAAEASGQRFTGLGLYWRLERSLRSAEGETGSVVGVTGALCALRRELFRELPAGLLLDDLALPLAVAQQGRRVVFCRQARVWDSFADPRHEFGRKLRTLGGNVQLVARWPWLLLPWRNPLWFRYLSHKLMRLLVPYALAAILVGTLLLPSPWRWLLLAPQAVSWGLGLVGRWVRPPGPLGLPVRVAHTFYHLNLAALLGPWLLAAGRLGWRPGGQRPSGDAPGC